MQAMANNKEILIKRRNEVICVGARRFFTFMTED